MEGLVSNQAARLQSDTLVFIIDGHDVSIHILQLHTPKFKHIFIRVFLGTSSLCDYPE